jgi:hypothetical protein
VEVIMTAEEYGPDRSPEGYGGGPPPPGPGHPPHQRRPEKQDEKQQEKEAEKQQEKGPDLDEKYRRNPLGVLSWAFLLIWLGVSLLLMNADIVEESRKGWAIFAWGGGVIVLAEAVTRLLVPRWRRPLMGSFIWGAVWIGVGFGLWYGEWEIIGPIVIIAVGVGMLAGRLVSRR